MPQMTNGKRVLHKYIGSAQTFSDDTIWEKLELDSTYQGTVYVKVDLVAKTVQLFGQIRPQALLTAGSVLLPKQETWGFNVPVTNGVYLRDPTGTSMGGNPDPRTYSVVSDASGNLTINKVTISKANCAVFSFNQSCFNPSAELMWSNFSNLNPVAFPITIN